MNERDKMLAGAWYDANYDDALLKERNQAKALATQINQTIDLAERNQLIEELIQQPLGNSEWLPPLMVDYGWNISLGDYVSINHNAYLMDGGAMTIGNHVFIGPNAGFYTARHPLNYKERDQGYEQALPITISDHVWIGGDVSILPGVTIGEGAVVGTGSVVTKDVPAHTVVAGNPARVIRHIDQEQTEIQ
ncbi:maltose acetyltransferase [Suicoccus acidiformans]|uniref:Maltose acetyltransferase n=1 Tax=Suicoccus acidiformans TaxID=2036206 RepID=A0A347WML7_9LACT|nr:sugar O-acetyltransferase [Suicoccus acidiformans]AXY26324.1 maltose acetyltransferase [Suicoccus acidiformans]